MSQPATVTIQLTIPRWFKNKQAFQIIAVAAPNKSLDIKEWLLREKDKAVPDWNGLADRFHRLGLAVQVAEHIITPPGGARFE